MQRIIQKKKISFRVPHEGLWISVSLTSDTEIYNLGSEVIGFYNIDFEVIQLCEN